MSTMIYPIPSNISITQKQQKNYVAYMWFYGHARGGMLKKKDVDKSRAQYWAKKLIALGWLQDSGDRWLLTRSRTIWSLMGCNRLKRGKAIPMGFVYTKLDLPEGLSDKDFFTTALNEIRRHIVNRKITQIRKVLKCSGVPRDLLNIYKHPFGCNAVAKLLGYSLPAEGNTSSAGHKYRKMFFNLVDTPLKREWRANHDGVPVCWYPASKIELTKSVF